MTVIQKFDHQNLRELVADINEALAAVGKKHGIQVSIGPGRFSSSSFNSKLSAAIIGAELKTDVGTIDPYLSDIPTQYINDYNRRIFKKKLLDTFVVGAKQYVIVGWRGRSVIGKPKGAPQGQRYRFTMNHGSEVWKQLLG